MSRKVKIAPSILSADFARLGEEVDNITKAGADYIHVDVMDGHFVPNLTIGPGVINAIRPYSNKVFDVHLMISPVDQYIEAFAESGADIITVHAEATTHLDRTISLIKQCNKKAGVSLVPSTSPDVLDYVLDKLDLVLVMSVNPGFGGQAFLPSQLPKIEAIREKIDRTEKDIDLEVDGGVTPETSVLCTKAGANVLVAGSAVFKGGVNQYATNIKAIRN